MQEHDQAVGCLLQRERLSGTEISNRSNKTPRLTSFPFSDDWMPSEGAMIAPLVPFLVPAIRWDNSSVIIKRMREDTR